MKRMVMVAALLTGCTNGGQDGPDASLPDPTHPVACSSGWAQFFATGTITNASLCPSACADQTAVEFGHTAPHGKCYVTGFSSSHLTAGRTAGEYECSSAFDVAWQGNWGCCLPRDSFTPPTLPVVYLECHE